MPKAQRPTHILFIALVLSPCFSTADRGHAPTDEGWSEIAKLLPNDGQPADYFGASVALSGETALVGASRNNVYGYLSGAAYVFERSGETWVEAEKLVPGDGAQYDRFGAAVALSGDTALVGAWDHEHENDGEGAAYVFTRSGGVWTEQAELTASDGAAHDFFGVSVALSGDTALVGSISDDNGFASGSVYVFVRAGDAWTEQAKILPSDGAASQEFGRSVAISGNTALLSARGDGELGDDAGAAYIFVRSGSGWEEEAKLTASDGAGGAEFGQSVALSAGTQETIDTALVGAHGLNANDDAMGSAYVFVRAGGVWSEQAKLLPASKDENDRFGYRVALSGDTALVGAYLDSENGVGAGAAFVFVRSGGSWTERAKLTASDASYGDHFGSHLGMSGNRVLIAASEDDDNGYQSGSAYVFQGSLIFGDDFESGDTSAWSTSVP